MKDAGSANNPPHSQYMRCAVCMLRSVSFLSMIRRRESLSRCRSAAKISRFKMFNCAIFPRTGKDVSSGPSAEAGYRSMAIIVT